MQDDVLFSAVPPSHHTMVSHITLTGYQITQGIMKVIILPANHSAAGLQICRYIFLKHLVLNY